MAVTAVRTYVLKAPLERPFFFSQPGWVTRRAAMVVELEDDSGRFGYGECLLNGLEPPEIARATVDSALADLVRGADPFDRVVLWERMYNLTRDFGLKGAVVAAVSAVDIALWDLAGQIAGLPVAKLLGGAFRDRVRAYATGFYRQTDTDRAALVEEARAHRAAGFSAMKVKIGFGPADDVATLAAIREAVGPDVLLMADANHAYNVATARRLIRELDALDLLWLEEPIAPEDVDGYRELRALGPRLWIAAGENEYTRHGFWPWVTRRAVDVLQPDLTAAGGFTGLRDIVALATAAGLMVNPHVWGTAIGLAASLQLLATLPPVPVSRGAFEPLLEFDRSAHPFRQDLVAEPIRAEDGIVRIPQGPGLGITVDRAALRRLAGAD